MKRKDDQFPAFVGQGRASRSARAPERTVVPEAVTQHSEDINTALPAATGTTRGVLTPDAQTFGGLKTIAAGLLMAAGSYIKSLAPDSDTVVALLVDTENAFGTAGAKLAAYRNRGAEKFSVSHAGNGVFAGTLGCTAVSCTTVNGTAVTCTSVTASSTMSCTTLTTSAAGSSIVQQAWQVPTFQNGWLNYDLVWNQAGYFKDSQGFVHLRGLVKSGTISATLPIFTLPAGYRPPTYRHTQVTVSNNAIGRVNIQPDGKVIPEVGSNVWFSLDGIYFDTR